jgi:hypothetical protein
VHLQFVSRLPCGPLTRGDIAGGNVLARQRCHRACDYPRNPPPVSRVVQMRLMRSSKPWPSIALAVLPQVRDQSWSRRPDATSPLDVKRGEENHTGALVYGEHDAYGVRCNWTYPVWVRAKDGWGVC